MPKQTPSIPNEILWARLGDRSALSDELWLIAAQVGMLLGRSTDQLAEDRKVGNPPPFKKDGGSIRYRLGSVRDHMFGSPEFTTTTQAKITRDKLSLGAYSSLQVWADTAGPDELWPFLIRPSGEPVDFWESLTLGDQLDDFHRCEWLHHDEYLEVVKSLAMERDFIALVDQIKRGCFESVRPSQLAEPPFDIISTPLHLHWIRELLSSSQENLQTLGQMAMATLTVAMQCKADTWGVKDGICFLLDINPKKCTGDSQEQVNRYLQAASSAMANCQLIFSLSEYAEVRVKPQDLLAWAKDAGIPIAPKVEASLKAKKIGGINPRRKPGAKPDPLKPYREKAWLHIAYEAMCKDNKITFSDVAAQIQKMPEFKNTTKFETIRRQLSAKKMIENGYVLPDGPWRR